MVESEKPRVAFVTGHGEASIDDFSPGGVSGLRELLERDNFELEVWSSLGAGAVPEGIDLVIVAGSRAGFVEPEVALLREYLEQGGRLLLLIDPTLSQFGGIEPTGLEELLAEYGVVMGENIIVDPGNPLPFFGPETLFLTEYGDHDVVRAIRQDELQVILPLARSVAKGEVTEGLEVTELFTTSDEGWGETDLENLLAVERGEDDLAGPVPIGVAVSASLAEGAGEAAEARLVVIGDSNFADNSQIHNASNGVLAANAINWLVDRQELVAIPPKTPEQTRLNLSASQLRTITWLVMVIMPGLAIAAGVAIHLRRRR
jgi:ABC-type uncharacterized transport system involved in gliding motility auxiliary subunit